MNGTMSLLRRADTRGRKFLNPIPTRVGGLSTVLKVLPLYLKNRAQRFPAVAPGPFATDARVYDAPSVSGLRVTWFGHSSMLLEIDGTRVLIDPVWEERASPVQWSGPKRFFAPTLPLADLPPIDVVLVSHDHYDHLGEATVRGLSSQGNLRDALWVTSLRVGAHLRRFGVEGSKIVELNWTETFVSSNRGRQLTVTSLPARHFSGRSLTRRDETLWASFALQGERHSVYYGADSGDWPGFAEIGESFRSFDLIMLEIGAFNALWRDIHLGPEGASNAFAAMKAGGLLMPIHWGLFDLALHSWTEPIEHLRTLADRRSIPLWSPEPGLPTDVVKGVELRSDWWMQRDGLGV